MARREALRRIEQAAAEAKDSENVWYDWVAMYHDRTTSVTSIAPDTLEGERCEEVTDEYYDVLWKVFKTGIDPVDAADEELKAWKVEKNETQSAEDFRRELCRVGKGA